MTSAVLRNNAVQELRLCGGVTLHASCRGFVAVNIGIELLVSVILHVAP